MQNITEICGQTPLVKLRNIIRNPETDISLKLEAMNGSGSIKMRPAKYIIERAEESGALKPGGTIIESSSGNFGIACAMIGAAKGYRVIMVVDPKTTPTNRALLEVYGAELVVIEVPDEDGAYHKSRISFADRLAQEIPNSFRPDQCFNLQNNEAHYQSTAVEILNQCQGRIDALIISVSTGGQIGGIGRYFHEHSPNTKIIAIEPVGSCIFGGKPHAYLLPGMGL
ncbi:MAG TPA: cysteine synthase family protein, partial [Gammaproteobacteria bacterium]|nr:cysteine synthase family protein [Gammaproteobacteria bacterium]